KTAGARNGGGTGKGSVGGESDLDSDDDPNEDPEARKARKKIRRACDYCTQKKVRCDGTPPCRQCQRRQIECTFSPCARSGPSKVAPPNVANPIPGVGVSQNGALAATTLAA
ncbi:unnamed protein product, partial [Ectocarpus fasciculatus]